MSTYPSQEHFNEIHREAHSYGEDGEWLVVAADYTEDEAVEKIKALIDEMHGTKDDTRYDYYDIPGIGMTAIGIGVNEDGEPDYVTNPKEPMYNAWCVEMI